MKLPKIFFRKLIIGAVLLAIATGMTAFIKESLDTQGPGIRAAHHYSSVWG